jgi:hypothetical protein
MTALAHRDHAHRLMSGRSSRPREGEARDRIRQAAYELFAERGSATLVSEGDRAMRSLERSGS